MPLDSTQLRALVPPDGWAWKTKPTLRTMGQLGRKLKPTYPAIETHLGALVAWALENSLGLTGTDGTGISGRGSSGLNNPISVYTEFRVKANAPARTRAFFGSFNCWNCGQVQPEGSVQCKSCMCAFCCKLCGYAGGRPYFDSGKPRYGRALCCAACTSKCNTPGCSFRADKTKEKCDTCDPPTPCHTCGEYFSKAVLNTTAYPGRNTCEGCLVKYTCPKCEVFRSNQRIDLYKGTKMCGACKYEAEDQERKQLEVIDADQMPASGSLVIVSSKIRPYRAISIETELNGDNNALSRTLYQCGMIAAPRVEGYHAHPNLEEEQFVGFLKHDGSVTGGELLLSLLRLDNEDHAVALLDVLKVLNSLKSMKKVNCGENCGGHIHVDAHNFPYGNAWRLLTLFNYLEDPIFRIAGGDAEYGHRTLTAKQREVAQAHGHSDGYTKSPVKGPFGTKSAFGKSIEEMGRTSALNFQPYLAARHNCRCGAHLAEDSRNCTCNLGKSTIEWRVFNSTINPRILHAWVAFIQAMMAYSSEDADPDAKWEKNFPAFPWAQVPFKSTGQAHRTALKQRLEWIFANLMLTDHERDSLAYCILQSDMGELGDDYIASLLNLHPAHDFLVKPEVRNPARRRRKIRITPPEPGKEPHPLKHPQLLWEPN